LISHRLRIQMCWIHKLMSYFQYFSICILRILISNLISNHLHQMNFRHHKLLLKMVQISHHHNWSNLISYTRLEDMNSFHLFNNFHYIRYEDLTHHRTIPMKIPDKSHLHILSIFLLYVCTHVPDFNYNQFNDTSY